MRPRPDDRLLPADAVRKILAHWHDPSTASLTLDLRQAIRDQWSTTWGGYTVTRNGRPTLTRGLGQHDGRAADGWSASDYLSVADSADLEPGSGDFSAFAIIQTPGNSSESRYLDKLNGSLNGWTLYRRSGGDPAFFFNDSNSDGANVWGSTNLEDGDTHLVGGVIDWGGDQGRVIADGTVENTASLSANNTDAIANAKQMRVGAQNDGSRPAVGLIGCGMVHNEWLSEPMWAYLDAAFRDRTLWVDNLPISGHPRTGLERRTPRYIANNPVDLWHDHARTYRHVDGDGAAQVTDLVGASFGVQRTSSSQPIARGPLARGNPLDHWEYTAADHHDHNGFTEDPSSVSVAIRLSQASGQSGADLSVWSHYDGATAEIDLRYDAGNNRYEIFISDSAGTTATLTDTSSGIDPTSGMHTVAFRVDESGDHALRIDGTEVATDTTDVSGGDLQSATRQTGARNGSGGAAFDMEEQVVGRNTAWTDSEFSDVESGIAA